MRSSAWCLLLKRYLISHGPVCVPSRTQRTPFQNCPTSTIDVDFILPRIRCEYLSGEVEATTKSKRQKLFKQGRQTSRRSAGFIVTWASLSQTITLCLAWQTKRVAPVAGGRKCGFLWRRLTLS